jgi:hypothetical protein
MTAKTFSWRKKWKWGRGRSDGRRSKFTPEHPDRKHWGGDKPWQVQEECTYKNRRGCATPPLSSTDLSVRQQPFPYSNTWTSVSKGA